MFIMKDIDTVHFKIFHVIRFVCFFLHDVILMACRVEPTEAGDYQICFDNSFSRFSEKMVFFEVILENAANDATVEDEWAGLGEPETMLEYKLEDIRVKIKQFTDENFNISHSNLIAKVTCLNPFIRVAAVIGIISALWFELWLNKL